MGPIYQAFIIYYHHLFMCAYLNVDGLKYMFHITYFEHNRYSIFGSDLDYRF